MPLSPASPAPLARWSRQTAVFSLQLLLLSALWGGTFPMMRIASPQLGPSVLAMGRIVVATDRAVAAAGDVDAVGARECFRSRLLHWLLPSAAS